MKRRHAGRLRKLTIKDKQKKAARNQRRHRRASIWLKKTVVKES